MTQAEESQKVINDAVAGNWLPFVTVLALLGVIVFLMGVILKIYINANEKKHEAHEHNTTKTRELLETAMATDVKTEKLLEKFGVLIEINQKEIHELRRK